MVCRQDALPLFNIFFSSRRRHTRFDCDWSSDVCSSDLLTLFGKLKKHLFFFAAQNKGTDELPQKPDLFLVLFFFNGVNEELAKVRFGGKIGGNDDIEKRFKLH